MAIKDQCEQCKKYNESCIEPIDYNGMSCDQYDKRINLEKIENTKDIVGVENKEEHIAYNDIKIHGWLTFFLFSIAVGGLFSAVYPILTFNVTEYDGSHFLAIGDVALGIMLFTLACYVIYSFCKRKSNAVFLAKMYVVVTFTSNSLLLLGGGYEDTGLGSLPQIICSLVWGIIWFLYLSFSEQVQDVIPKSYRKTFSRDYYFMVAFIIIPILCMAIGIGDIFSQRKEQEKEFISTTELNYNEYTDGRIIFTKPDGFTCEKQELEDPKITLFDLESEYGYIRIVSDYDTDISVKNFNSYWEEWEDDELKNIAYKEILNEKREINDNPYFIKSVLYKTENPIKWDFAMLFNPQTGKVCVIHSLQNETQCLEELMKTIRF